MLENMMQPMTLLDLRTHFDESRCLVLEGAADKFLSLISPEDIERRLNDGCNASLFAQIIKGGSRGADTDSNCCWAPASMNKEQFTQDIESGLSFMMPNSSQINPQLSQLVTELEDFFIDEHMHADVHLYVSTDAGGNSYNAHRDFPQHKILLQAYGAANWQIFEPKTDKLPEDLVALTEQEQEAFLNVVADFTLGQGDMLYMPPGTFHRVSSVMGPRISISIPFYSMSKANRMDRRFIPFQTIFDQSK